MSKYIDERPFEEVVRATTLDRKHKEYVDTIVTMILRDEESGWQNNPFRGDHTLYDVEIALLKRDKERFKSELEQVQKHYDSVFNKIVELKMPEEDGEKVDVDIDDEEKEEEEHQEKELFQEKGKTTLVRLKPAQLAKKQKNDAVARQNFKASLATLQEQLRELMKQVRDTESELERYEYFQEVSIKVLISLRRILNYYKEHHDVEFVEKGAYFVRDYSMMLMDRFDETRV